MSSDFVDQCLSFDESVRCLLLQDAGVLQIPLNVRVPVSIRDVTEGMWGRVKDAKGKMSPSDVDIIKTLASTMVGDFIQDMAKINDKNQPAGAPDVPYQLTGIEKDICKQMATWFLHKGMSHLVLAGRRADFELVAERDGQE